MQGRDDGAQHTPGVRDRHLADRSHGASLQQIAERASDDEDRQTEKGSHTVRNSVVRAGVRPTRPTPTVIRSTPAQRAELIGSPKTAKAVNGTSAYPAAVAGST